MSTTMPWAFRLAVGATASLCFAATAVRAQDAAAVDPRNEIQNPVGGRILIPFQSTFDVGSRPGDRDAFSLRTRPVIPVHLTPNWILVSRILVNAVLYRPDPTRPSGGVTGLGDISPTFFVIPARVGRIVWGIGPALSLPTATSPTLGQGKWALGPAIAAFTQGAWGTVGVIGKNQWTIAGDETRPNVNQMSLEFSASYNLADAWYLTAQPELDADWNASTRDRWSVPLRIGVGRLFQVGKDGLSAAVLVDRDVGRAAAAPWRVDVQAAFLVPTVLRP